MAMTPPENKAVGGPFDTDAMRALRGRVAKPQAARCPACRQAMMPGVSCTVAAYDGAPRVRHSGEGPCHDCNCPPGGLHHPMCQAEGLPYLWWPAHLVPMPDHSSRIGVQGVTGVRGQHAGGGDF